MYKCVACGCIYETPQKYPDFSGEYRGVPFTKYYEGCPRCREEDKEVITEENR